MDHPFVTAAELRAALSGSNFSWEVEQLKPRCIISIEGDEKSGKTSLALSAPGPIVYLNIDKGEEGVIQKFKQKTIAQGDYEFKIPTVLDRDNKDGVITAIKIEYERFLRDYRAAIAARARTIVIDTMSDLWEFMRLARLGKLAQVMPLQYVEVNNEFRELIRLAFSGDSNLILLHKLKDEWEGSNKSGRRERKGMADVGYLVQATVRTRYVKPVTRRGPNGANEVLEAGRWWVDVLDSRAAPELSGYSFENVQFAQIAGMLNPDINPAAWYD